MQPDPALNTDAPSAAPVTANIETRLADQQQQIQSMLQTAPDASRANLREALVATQRSRALVADPQVIERALGRPTTRLSAAAHVPTVAAEEVPTIAPTPPKASPPVTPPSTARDKNSTADRT